jgi:exopolyphosphatase / guanosine-5'-triphosphate,3'-diphosphate pyrophosphatase
MQEIPKKIAAIDIGSNAVRLLIYHIYPNMQGELVFKKFALTRVPLRLGADVFARGRISEQKAELLGKTMLAFKNLLEVHGIEDWRACATSAMREAENREEVRAKVWEKAAVDINIIEGEEEADLIFETHIADKLDPAAAYLYMDVGGGSTELTLFSKGSKQFSRSFRLGTVRLLHGKVFETEWHQMKECLKDLYISFGTMQGIGSGGNIIKIKKMSGIPEPKPMSRSRLQSMYKSLSAMSYDERIRSLNLNPDRADVILPAAEIFLFMCKHAQINQIWVPKTGLSDGIIRSIYTQSLKKEA